MRESKTRSARSARAARRKIEPKDERAMERRGRATDTFGRRVAERRRSSREPEYK
jgi:hypothetical protein